MPVPPRNRHGLLVALLVLLCVTCALLGGGVGYFALGGRQIEQPATKTNAPRPASNAGPSKTNAAGELKGKKKRAEAAPRDATPAPKREPAGDATVAAAEGSAENKTPPKREVLGLYSQRTAPRREEWISQAGGTPESETAVAAGLEWLARHQADDGHWGPDCLGKTPGAKCEPGSPCSRPGYPYEAALTGLAVLAFQAAGHYDFNHHRYSPQVSRGLHCLAEQQGFNGELVGSLNDVSEGPGEQASRLNRCYMYEHSIATFALAEACALAKAADQPPKAAVWQAAVKGVRFIETQQHDDGGWRYAPDKRQLSDSSVSGWAMLALKTAREAEIEIRPETVPRLIEFFDRLQEPLTGRTHYQAGRFGTDALTGVGMMVDEFVRHDPGSKRIQLAAPYLADQAESNWGPNARSIKPDYYLWYNCTLAMFQVGGEPWKRWNDATRERIIALQEHGDACARGSWPPHDPWSGDGGRIYSTALAVLTLEVYYRFAKENALDAAAVK